MLSVIFQRLRQNIPFTTTYFGVLFAFWFFSTPNSSTVEDEYLEAPNLTLFGLGEDISKMRAASCDADSLWSSRQDLVVSAFQHAWKGYSQYAFGSDEYYPLEKKGENFLKKGLDLLL
ncbi:mannosyl-oligosaccharide alpha-1,2-mannosidase [Entomophthora muscae]|uniref:Mannosyl-oligosaccharide alpha-1,2-mannosidase n=1 Tax=Entomophthora muscae TaxID=34485 RepID=A0ACC2UA39_9FUNG|nr:mannosyl-oligosaccharide alpha-1,2-mannosidase [Entomophthora muscae]